MGNRILGIDYGSKRIGISISDPMNIIAKSLIVLCNDDTVIENIMNLLEQYDVSKIVVGKPLTLKGKTGSKLLEVRAFIEKLKSKIDIEIIEWDERFTTQLAHKTMKDMGVSKKKRRVKESIDEMASALILQSYLDTQRKLVKYVNGNCY